MDGDDEQAQRETTMWTPPVSINTCARTSHRSKGFSGRINDKHIRQFPNCFTAQVKEEPVIDY